MFELNRYVTESKERPLLNYFSEQLKQYDLSRYTQIQRKKRIMYLVLKTPELVGMLMDITMDIVKGLKFISPDGSNAKTRIQRAKRWKRNVKFDQELIPMVFDWLVTGELYSHMGSNATELIKSIEKSSQAVKNRFYDEDLINPLFRHVASTTMSLNHDEYNLTGYSQTVSAQNAIPFSISEILRLTYFKVDGKLEGYTPLYSVPLQLELLWLVWSNQHDLQLQGNMPDYMVVAKDIRTNSQSLKEVEKKLQSYNTPGNKKHGITLLHNGDYSFEKMERDTTLQFKEVGQAITSILAGLYKSPQGRLAVKTEESAKSKDSPGDGERNYYNRVSQWQDIIAESLNTQLFEPFFGVVAVFDKGYLYDDLVEGQALNWRLNNSKLLNDTLRMSYKKQLSPEYLIDVYNGEQQELTNSHLEEAPEETIMMPGTQNQQMNKGELGQGMSSEERQKKSNEANDSNKNKGSVAGNKR